MRRPSTLNPHAKKQLMPKEIIEEVDESVFASSESVSQSYDKD